MNPEIVKECLPIVGAFYCIAALVRLLGGF